MALDYLRRVPDADATPSTRLDLRKLARRGPRRKKK
jgi:hypothetical protein